MLRLEDICGVIDAMLAQGVDDYDQIVDRVYAEFADEVEVEAAIRNLIRRRVSLAIASLRDSDGERMAFPDRSPDGTHRIVHLTYTFDPAALVRVSKRYEHLSNEAARIASRTYERAVQLGLFDREAA